MVKKYAYKGKKYTEQELVELAKKEYNLDLNLYTIRTRLYRSGDVTKAISTPARKQVRDAYEYEGQHYTLKELCGLAKEKFGLDIPFKTLYQRLARSHWDVTKAISTPGRQYARDEEAKYRTIRRTKNKYARTHPKKLARIRTLSYARSFIRNYVTSTMATALRKELETQLSTGEYSPTEWPQNADYETWDSEEQRKYRNLITQTRLYLNEYATKEGIQELLNLLKQ